LSPLLVIAIPVVLITIGIILSSLHIVHDQPQYSLRVLRLEKQRAKKAPAVRSPRLLAQNRGVLAITDRARLTA
jgi:hypothetical protein